MHWTEISDRRVGKVVVFDLRGYLALAEEDKRLMPAVAAILAAGDRLVLLNLQHLSFIDSPGIGEIVGAYTKVARLGGALTLCEPSPRVREVLEATNLDSVLEIFETEDEALRSMATSASRRSQPPPYE